MRQKERTLLRKMCEKLFGIQVDSRVYLIETKKFVHFPKGIDFPRYFDIEKNRKGIVVRKHTDNRGRKLIQVDFGSPYNECWVEEKDVRL